ncbi:MAG: hypothetical protein ABI867_43170 [Kofleriaceae bacterium]
MQAIVMRLVILAVLLLGCHRQVAQDAHSGRDGQLEGAQAMRPTARDSWIAYGVVTYPGGDRVDWHRVHVPVRGDVTITLRVKAMPRPGMLIWFDVFDEWGKQLAYSHGKPVRSVFVDRGELFIRVYAKRRGDAGAYVLGAHLAEYVPPHGDDFSGGIDWPDPPRLPAVPDPECTTETFDPKRADCARICPVNAPPNWSGCSGPPPNWCPTPPTVSVRGCWETMPCPDPPDPRVKACPPVEPSPPPMIARIINKTVAADHVVITIAMGSNAGVTKTWNGKVVRDRGSTVALPGGSLVIVRVDKTITVATVKLTPDQISAHPWVRLSPP